MQHYIIIWRGTDGWYYAVVRSTGASRDMARAWDDADYYGPEPSYESACSLAEAERRSLS